MNAIRDEKTKFKGADFLAIKHFKPCKHFCFDVFKYFLPVVNFMLSEQAYALVPVADAQVRMPSPINFIRQNYPAGDSHCTGKMGKRGVVAYN